MQKKCKRNLPKSAKLREFRQSNFELSFQPKMRRNFGSSIVLMSAKFRKQCVSRNEISLPRKEISFPRNEISFRWGEISSAGTKFRL